MATMLLGGLWHGANWTFVAWGGLHGIYLWIERYLKDKRMQLIFIKNLQMRLRFDVILG
jgi:D-alanyl-lipoteichoic acid acyltransferase DltB (MBOAT superfamily)